MLKESLKLERPENLSLNISDSVFINPMFPRKPLRWDATKEYIPRLGFNYKENSLLLSFRDEYELMKTKEISPYLKANLKLKEADPYSTETANDAFVNVVITPLASIIMINPVEFFNYLMRAGVLSDEPFVPKKSRKERMLKTITQDVYHIDDY